jgi:hypothetical protein
MISVDGDPRRPERVAVLGYAQALDAPLLVGWAGALGAVALPVQLAGQAVLCAGTSALLAYLKPLDGARDVRTVQDELHAARRIPPRVLCPRRLRRAWSRHAARGNGPRSRARQWRNLHGGAGTGDGSYEPTSAPTGMCRCDGSGSLVIYCAPYVECIMIIQARVTQ